MMVHRRLLALAGDLRGPLAAGVAIGWLVMAARVAQAALVGVVLGRIFTGAELRDVRATLIAIAVIVVLRALLVWAREVVAQLAAAQIKERVRDRLYGQLTALGPGYLARVRTGAAQSTVVDGVEALEAYFSRYLPQLAVCLTGPLAIVAWIFTRDPWVGATILLGVLAVPTVPRIWDRLLAERGRTHWNAYSALGAEYLDTMQGMATLKSLNAVASRRRLLADRSDHLFRSTMRQMAVSLIDTGLSTLGAGLGVALAVGVGAVRVAQGELDVATLMVLLVLAGECFRPFGELTGFWHAGFLGVSASDGIAALLDERPAAPDRRGAPALPPGAPASISFEDVTFTYPGRGEPAVAGLSLALRPGETVALVGRSGAGKSTVVNLLLRFVAPDSGTIAVGGHDVAAVRAASLRERIAVVSQDAYLFRGTIAENLRLARPDASDAELVAAARDASVHAFVASLPDGYDTLVGERGLTLSGGQRQRLAIARALLRDAPILVLDEATSSVDAENEAAIGAALRRLTAGRTTLVIAHRLNTVRTADRILVIADGRLVEHGTHDELAARAGHYADLVAAQAVLAA
ncbi:MAG: thiol reductant ABC exporter subunit CydD [Solirubrobacteraceae bacterium]|nr:thiol reductant ABC exporter subunit CydD [Solirubrobacteraceae bacterium]